MYHKYTLTYQKYKKKIVKTLLSSILNFALIIGRISAQSHMLLFIELFYFFRLRENEFKIAKFPSQIQYFYVADEKTILFYEKEILLVHSGGEYFTINILRIIFLTTCCTL
jgi:hypothetical protein